MKLKDWIDQQKEHHLYPHAIYVVGQKNGSYSTNDNIFAMELHQPYAKQLFGEYEIAFINVKMVNDFAKLAVFLDIPVPEEMKRK